MCRKVHLIYKKIKEKEKRKMLKKTMAILLSMALLLTLCPMTGVFAALPEYSKMDDFQDEAVRS